MSQKGLSRRNFLKAMAAAAATATVTPRSITSALAAPAKQGTYKEAPMLADLVAAGTLPPVDQRLPVNPRVITPTVEVGQYGGTLHRAFKGLSDRWGPVKLNEEGAVQWDAPDPENPTMVAHYVSEWTQNEDATQYTFKLREGLKWSDGTPFTTADVQFYYDKIFVPELYNRPSGLNVGLSGESTEGLMQIEVLDELTWKCTFSVSNPLLILRFGNDTMGQVCGPSMAAPKHYLEKFLGDSDTADQTLIDAAMQKNGVSTWQELWYEQAPGDARGPINFWYRNPDLPVITPWKAANTPLDDPWIMERNPYYHAVDTEGNQLPYIDRIEHALFQDAETFNLWIAQGQIDFQQRHTSTANYTFYKENEATGDYKVMLWKAGSTNAFYPNISHPDPAIREMFDNADFREALSIAIDRDELNQLVYSGQMEPRQASPVSGSPNYDPDFESKWITYDPDRANQLLDNLGYAKQDDGYRLRPDGQKLAFTITYALALGSMNPDEVQVVMNYWNAIGIRVNLSVLERSFLEERNRAGDVEVGVWPCDRSSVVMVDPRRYLGQIDDGPWAPNYAMYMSDIVYGDGTTSRPFVLEPAADHPVRKIADLWHQCEREPDEATRNALFKELLDIHKEHPYMIGTVGEDPVPIIVKNNIGNVVAGFVSDDTMRHEGIARPKQMFIRS